MSYVNATLPCSENQCGRLLELDASHTFQSAALHICDPAAARPCAPLVSIAQGMRSPLFPPRISQFSNTCLGGSQSHARRQQQQKDAMQRVMAPTWALGDMGCVMLGTCTVCGVRGKSQAPNSHGEQWERGTEMPLQN